MTNTTSNSLHGTLIKIFNQGVLITGPAGIGKSELALNLIDRGHKLVADDFVNLRRERNKLTGSSAAITKNLLQVYGLGIIPIKKIYGEKSTAHSAMICVLIQLITNNRKKMSDYFKYHPQERDILGIKIPEITLPVTGFSNLALLTEVLIKNITFQQRGHNAAEQLTEKHRKLIQQTKRAYVK